MSFDEETRLSLLTAYEGAAGPQDLLHRSHNKEAAKYEGMAAEITH